ncbi:UDP-N-acetylmuramyl peptide synthase [Gardnerella vaginalis]|uniref:UDP-N-acetylmuramyl peptide synthase n=1 Tax=Gardnerella vaginalis TaxID=2702 RepID=UPI000942A659|nr:UDP-N-acetylmuramyl peptide synthase [Gardnerella vaginalis]AYZ21569.1 UDP-N-acetylmuramyl peptide synthase [Gardnerella vaginalis]NSX27464.1 UDP-N-acetylmuramyl peptide synthase [Gardnerella vaginalis]OKY55606.1 UDP-N-acetylmuramoyl-L-alanyl-D-glutamate--2,6-diaminopimelate ligase [Gardnerella vaginalis]PNL25696.1 UDP-N-acetylmuramyl peptide synthase [Gardnerella vaginalis]PTE04538.1 UDP-N-acetylmuramyl peptide synthase [Gardnerella vaginalis]
MNAVDEFSRTRVTLGFAAEQYGFEVIPSFASGVTITSLACDVRSVKPGCLFVPSSRVDKRQLEAARDAGAYAAMVPPEFRSEAMSVGIPLLVSSNNPITLGKLACDVNCDPSSFIATFAVAGDSDDEIYANVIRLADFLHMLGNPVGIISAAGSSSLQRELDLEYPMGIIDIQHNLSVCVEDGAAAVVIALNSATLSKDALQSVNVDVLGVESNNALAMAGSLDLYASDSSYSDSYSNTSKFDSHANHANHASHASHADDNADNHSYNKKKYDSDTTLNQNSKSQQKVESLNSDSESHSESDSVSDISSSRTSANKSDKHYDNSFIKNQNDDSAIDEESMKSARPVISFYTLQQRYGFVSHERSYCVMRSRESDELAALADQIGGKDVHKHLSLSIAMVLAAGVRRGTIKSALRVSHELK